MKHTRDTSSRQSRLLSIPHWISGRVVPFVTRRTPPALVWGTWAACLAGALWYVARFGTNLPKRDDFAVARAVVTGQVSARWMYSLHNEHRLFWAKGIMAALYGLTRDFRSGLVFNALGLAAAAAALIGVAGRLRGRTSPTDAVFPLALLHWGQPETFLLFFQVSFVTATLLLTGLLTLVVRKPGPPTGWESTALGVGLLMLPGCGAYGLVYTPALALWLVYQALRDGRSPEPGAKRNARKMLGFAVAGLIFTVFYFPGLHFNEDRPRANSPLQILVAAGHFLSTCLGYQGRQWWPVSVLLVQALLLSSAVPCFLLIRWHPGERTRALGLLCFLGTVAGLALATGWGRGGTPGGGWATRYALLATPLLFCVYFAWLLGGGRWGACFQWLVLLLVAAAFPANAAAGLELGRSWRAGSEEFEAAVRNGVPYREIARHFSDQETQGFKMNRRADNFAEAMLELRRAGVEPFTHLNVGEESLLIGTVAFAAGAISGSAYDELQPERTVEVAVYDGDTLLFTERADKFHQKLGQHGFEAAIPESLKDGKPHKIRVVFADTGLDLKGSPRNFRAPTGR